VFSQQSTESCGESRGHQQYLPSALVHIVLVMLCHRLVLVIAVAGNCKGSEAGVCATLLLSASEHLHILLFQACYTCIVWVMRVLP
jgi:hypothetical protein